MNRNIQVRNLDKSTAKNLDQFKKDHYINTDAKAVIFMINRERAREKTIANLEKEKVMLTHQVNEQIETLETIRNGFEALNTFKASFDGLNDNQG